MKPKPGKQSEMLMREEISQARTRIVAASLCLTIFAITYLLNKTQLEVLVFTLSASVFSVSWLALVTQNPGDYPWRRQIIVIFDVSAVSYAIYLAGEWGATLYFLYLWVIVANGMRFGLHQLIRVTILGFVEFSIVVTQSEYWRQNISISTSLLMGLLILPAIYFILIKRLHELTEKLDIELQKATYSATHDSLTGLLSREYFFQRTDKLAHDARQNHQQFALLFIDLDGFKEINDTFGHHAGDQVLIKSAEKLSEIVRKDDLVARLGGDEFAIVLCNLNREQVELFARRILSAVEESCQYEGNALCVTASIGVSLFPEHGISGDELVKSADIAMYQSKQQGKNRFTLLQCAA